MSPTNVKRIQVFLSDGAWEGLVNDVGEQIKCPPQLSRIMKKLPNKPALWTDTRPSELVDFDPAAWCWEVPRYRRTVQVSEATRSGLYTLAQHFNINNHKRSSHNNHVNSCISSLLEAIGLGFLSLTGK